MLYIYCAALFLLVCFLF